MVDVPTVIFGKTRSGKTYHAQELFLAHEGPAVYCDVQLEGYARRGNVSEVWSVEEVVERLTRDEDPKVLWSLRDYNDVGILVDYLMDVHWEARRQGIQPPRLALFFDEAWRVANRWADATNPCVKVFTSGYGPGIVGVAISQWVAQICPLIPMNAYEWLVYHVFPHELELLRSNYKMEVPDTSWISDLESRRYWRYNGEWLKEEGLDTGLLQEGFASGETETGMRQVRRKDEAEVLHLETWRQAEVGSERMAVSSLRSFKK